MSHRLCAAIYFVATWGSAHALTLDQALQRAEERSPLVKRARAELNIVAAARVGAGVILPYNPALSGAFGFRWDRSSSVPPAQGFEWALRVEQTIEIAGQRGRRLKEADAGVRVAAARLRVAVVEARARARGAYVGALLMQSAVESARRREELGKRLFDSARARVQAGAASDVELHLAEVERGRLESDRLEAELAVADARAELTRLVGDIDELTPLSPPELAPNQNLLERARLQRADLKALDERTSELDAQLTRLKREVVPSPTLFLDVATAQPGQIYAGGGLALPLPIWQRNQGPIAVARATKEAVAVEKEVLEREIALEVARAERTTKTRQREAELWQRNIVPAAEANVELIEQGWRAGKFDLFRVITAAREAGEARRTQLERLGALWQSLIELDRVTGTP